MIFRTKLLLRTDQNLKWLNSSIDKSYECNMQPKTSSTKAELNGCIYFSTNYICIYITKGCHLHLWVFLAVNIFWGDRNWTKLAAYLRKAISISAEKHWTFDILMKPRELGNRNAPSWGNAGVRWILKLNKLPHLWCSKVSVANWSNCEQREYY